MKLLLDENLPSKLKYRLRELGHIALTVGDQGWRGKENGELLKLLLSNAFEVLLTMDSSLPYQQNFKKYPVPVIILKVKTNRYADLIKLLPNLTSLLNSKLTPGPQILVENR